MHALGLLRFRRLPWIAPIACAMLVGCDQIHSSTRCQLQKDDDGAWAQYVTAQMISPGTCPLRLTTVG
jgi:hypothetical protein